MAVGIPKKIDNLGRLTIPKEYRDFYHMVPETEVSVEGTPEGLLITHPKYKMVEIETKKV
ncbi:MAG: AbrB/MazE/SpoVT family DNA-binding domain-containing protein [Clostridia bacterium]|nr:AbrB/MazE/SpoVT family DNA-binding domain-containing protein [Clostridia bacterium]